MFIKDAKNFNLPEAEEKVLDYWKKNRIFERSLERRQIAPRQNSGRAKGKSRKFVFYEGPPTANGRPGIHHVLARAFKDVILRYKTMRGYYVPRRAGWDTHGLPVEIQVEKELGLKSKKDIEKYGIAEFNRKCRESVWKHKDEWERLTERMGFWLDMKNPYVTYEKDYIETLWWIVAQFWKKKLLYKGNRIVNWCPRCGTGLSSHEMAQGYKTVTDEAAYIKFKLKRQATRDKRQVLNAIKGDVFILSWTTTPWTLPGNVALAVGEKINYVMLEVEKLDVGGPKKGEVLILAKERLEALGIQGKIIKEVKGKDLIGLVYQPLFEVKPLESKNSYKIYGADFVTTTEGTGVVHTAVMYGEDDYKLGVKMGLPQHHTVDEAGKFTKDVKGLAGLYVKAKETEKKIFDYLTKNNNLLKTESYKHEYPHCWRCSTPLLYYARVSWFVAMAKLKKKLWKNNETINWTPEHVKNGRFGEWLREVKDWNFSRERYWGTPLPIWECKKCEHREVVGGIDELSMLAKEDSNVYWAMRHGEAEGNVRAIIDSGNQHFRLSTIGRDQAKRAAEKLKAKSIDIIFASDLTRTRETAGIVAKVLGIKRVVYDKRLREINLSSLSGQPVDEYRRRLPIEEERFSKHAVPGAESLRDVRRRSWEFLSEVGKKFKRKKILFVSHEDTIWMLAEIANGWSEKITADKKEKNGEVFMGPAEFLDFKVKSLPRDETGLVDLHRPYVDEVVLRCVKCKGEMRRVKELADVWFDS
ncbi:MAG: class I tRNA ligase family protein, partial [Candidatus Liptonbacteria bacterium]|nr:class I tRNA ligase family protein [Candidatus Liptonbacteria bacterium]